MVRCAVGRDHAEGDILSAAALDPTRGALAERVRVEQEGDHRLRVVGGAAPAVIAVVAVEGGEVDSRHGVDHKPREVVVEQPLAQARRKQQLLVAVAGQEVLRHGSPRR